MFVTGYADRLSVATGDTIRFMISCEGSPSYSASVVRLIHGHEDPAGPGFKSEPVTTSINGTYAGRMQESQCGSHVLVRDDDQILDLEGGFTIHAFVWSTTPLKGRQGILTRWSERQQLGYGMILDDEGCLALLVGAGPSQTATLATGVPLQARVWYSVAVAYDAKSRRATLHQQAVVTATNGLWAPTYPFDLDATLEARVGVRPINEKMPTVIGAMGNTGGVAGHYNGKIERPQIYDRLLAGSELEGLSSQLSAPAGLVADWDFAHGVGPGGIPSGIAVDTSGHGLHGECVNMPARGVTGHNWSGREENFTQAPYEYGALYFHDDDLEDAGWSPDLSLTIPDGLPSGIYAVQVCAGEAEDHIPFFVRPRLGAPTARIAFLVPTASYMAYGNEHVALEGSLAEALIAHTPSLTASDLHLQEHIDYGVSHYDVHSDGSGVYYSSRLRPLLNMRPKYRSYISSSVWQLAADLDLVDWLSHEGHAFDVITDEDLHREGLDLLVQYGVVLTGTHPEYYSSPMLDAIEQYVAGNGRLMYLGGNGFYWMVSFHPERPHVMELRRGEGGARAWQAPPGEYYHSTTGQKGGLWRNRGRPPQRLVGVGFTGQGFDRSSSYHRMPDSFRPEAGFIFEGVEGPTIGAFGLVGGGAAGLELDRYDLQLGSPPNTLLLATSVGHSDAYLHTAEEIPFMYPGIGGTQDYQVRSDMTYFTSAGGGAVFSVGSIAWCGALSHDDYENNVARITGNVLNRFLSQKGLPASNSEHPE